MSTKRSSKRVMLFGLPMEPEQEGSMRGFAFFSKRANFFVFRGVVANRWTFHFDIKGAGTVNSDSSYRSAAKAVEALEHAIEGVVGASTAFLAEMILRRRR